MQKTRVQRMIRFQGETREAFVTRESDGTYVAELDGQVGKGPTEAAAIAAIGAPVVAKAGQPKPARREAIAGRFRGF